MRIPRPALASFVLLAVSLPLIAASEGSRARQAQRPGKRAAVEARERAAQDTAPAFGAPAPAPAGSTAALAAPPACGATPATASFAGTSGAIPDATPIYVPGSYTASVSGLGPYLWDLDLTTSIAHTSCSELDVRLTSPAGTTVVITTDNGGSNQNVFNGTVWNDNVNAPVTDALYSNNVLAATLSPEGRLSSFRGEDPNGTWTLTVRDNATLQTGAVDGWSLAITTLASAPVESSTTYSVSPGLALNGITPTAISTIVASGLGTYLSEVELYVEIPHGFSEDVDLSLRSPSGPTVIACTDNSDPLFGDANAFDGSLFDADAPAPVSDYLYVSGSPATPISPEGAFDNWLGQDPNGTWTLTATDDFPREADGVLARWDLTLRTIPAPAPSAPAVFAGTTGPIPDYVPGSMPHPIAFTAQVSGVGASLWDVDLWTELTHPFPEDIDVTLTSPAGTVVVVTTDNALFCADAYNGTRWDDLVIDPVTDHLFTPTIAAATLSPEGRFAAFRGEDPNGTWTLTIADDLVQDIGSLTSWSLDVSTLAAPVAEANHAPIVATPALAISATGQPLVTSTLPVSGVGILLTKVRLYVEVQHTSAEDLEISLTSPAGTVVKVTTDNGGSNDDVFNGTLFDPSAAGLLAPASDAAYADLVTQTTLSPEGAFDAFFGQNPNGTWTLSVKDDAHGNGGTLARWELRLSTCGNPPPVAYCFGDGSSLACPCSPVPIPHGAPGRGCPNPINPSGALLGSSGTPSISADTFVLQGSGMGNTAAVLYFQANAAVDALFGDAKRCATSNVRRFKLRNNVGGASSYPQFVTDNPVHTAGQITVPVVRYYQGWYRAAQPFCTPETFNLTNGLSVIWSL